MVETVKEISKISHKGGFLSGGKNQKDIKPLKLSEVRHIEKNRIKSTFNEFDRVMGGGIVPGSVTLLAGEPGIGKSTLLLHVLSKIGGLYVSGEESAEQIKLRAKRLNIKGDNIRVLADTDVERVVDVLLSIKETEKGNAQLVIIDSIQTLSSSDLSGMAGSVGQVRYSTEKLAYVAKTNSISIIIIGHVTKEGTIAGPKILEHMVDTVLYLEGERFANARILKTLKNRFGAIEEVGIFEMEESGLKEVANPSKLFLQDRVKNTPGSVVTVLMEGIRPILVEIQALIVPSQLVIPRRVSSGFDFNRLALIIAVLQKRLGIPLGTNDIFINVSGGLRVAEPSADLAVAVAIYSSFRNKPVHAKAVVFGELGLLGEVRNIQGSDRRGKEAKRLGFTYIVSPPSVKNLKQAVSIVS